MSNEIIDKVLRIMELAMLINPSCTQKEKTGNKPTVFVWFSGHCNNVLINIYPEGWSSNDEGFEQYDCFMDDDPKIGEMLNKAIERLEGIYKDVLEGKYNDTI